MTSETIWIITAVVAVVLAAYALYKRPTGKPVTGELIVSELRTATPLATEIVNVVSAGVFAAEQLKRTGKLPDNNAAFDYALKHAQKVLPNLDRETLTTYIESAVFTAKAIADKANSNDTPKPSGPTIRPIGLL